MVFIPSGFGCTTFVVTDEASEDGSTFVCHTNDGFGPGLIGHQIREDMVSFRHIMA